MVVVTVVSLRGVEGYAFLVGYPEPPPGWINVRSGETLGTNWEPVLNDHFFGEIYYRQRLSGISETPQAFVVKVGSRWVASMTTQEWTKIELANQMRLHQHLCYPCGNTEISIYLKGWVHVEQVVCR